MMARLSLESGLEIPRDGPPDDRHSFAKHDEIIASLESHDRWALMRRCATT